MPLLNHHAAKSEWPAPLINLQYHVLFSVTQICFSCGCFVAAGSNARTLNQHSLLPSASLSGWRPVPVLSPQWKLSPGLLQVYILQQTLAFCYLVLPEALNVITTVTVRLNIPKPSIPLACATAK
ncbi:hypothetical protein DL98DRAFT_253021 [Cadophora sp. DSE1049]|nr:hypothetical protein DL98DRAFT_253021 [Cadophora sp. DSE1049]